jgi:hypothetical protein
MPENSDSPGFGGSPRSVGSMKTLATNFLSKLKRSLSPFILFDVNLHLRMIDHQALVLQGIDPVDAVIENQPKKSDDNERGRSLDL